MKQKQIVERQVIEHPQSHKVCLRWTEARPWVLAKGLRAELETSKGTLNDSLQRSNVVDFRKTMQAKVGRWTGEKPLRIKEKGNSEWSPFLHPAL
jgi:hypothetical protein